MARVLLNLPASAKKGEIVTVKLLISHPMETGYRRDDSGQLVPRNVITKLRCAQGDREVMSLELHPAIAANPYFVFSFRAETSGPVEISWIDEQGVAGFVRRDFSVE